MLGFLFGEGTDTPSAQELARKRAIINQLMGRDLQPQTFASGVRQFGGALAGRFGDRRLDPKEDAERERSAAEFARIAAMLGQPMSAPPMAFGASAPVAPAQPEQPPVQGAPVPPVTTSPIPAAGPAGGPVPGAPAPLPPQIAAAVDRVDPQGGMAQGGSQGQFTEAGISSMGTPGQGVSPEFARHIPGIFAGESGGDYDALFGFSNREGGPFGNVRLTDMTVNDAIAFSDPSGPYANWVKGQVGHVATPMGAYQVVGSTLRAAMRGMGLTGNEQMTPELQDKIGEWIFENQGLGAWVGYRPGVTEMPTGGGGRYAGPTGGGMTETMSSMGTSGPSGGNMAIVMQLAELMGNPYLPEGQRMVAQMLIQQQMGNMDPMRQIQLQQAQMELDGGGMTNNVRASQILTDGTVVQSTDSGVRVFHPARGELTGQEAADAIAEANRQEVENQRAINEGRRLGTYDADIAAGGTAAAAIAGGEAAVAQGVAAYEAYRNISGNIGSIDRAIAALDAGGKSGAFDALLPDITVASAELRNAMDSMGLDVIGAVTFGALSEAELKLAMETAVPRNLDEPQLREWLVARRVAQEKAADMLQNAALFLMTPGNTIPMWIERNRTGTAPASGGANPFAAMGDEELRGVDLNSLTPEEFDLWIARARELEGQ
jgi:hypothetical protein